MDALAVGGVCDLRALKAATAGKEEGAEDTRAVLARIHGGIDLKAGSGAG